MTELKDLNFSEEMKRKQYWDWRKKERELEKSFKKSKLHAISIKIAYKIANTIIWILKRIEK